MSDFVPVPGYPRYSVNAAGQIREGSQHLAPIVRDGVQLVWLRDAEGNPQLVPVIEIVAASFDRISQVGPSEFKSFDDDEGELDSDGNDPDDEEELPPPEQDDTAELDVEPDEPLPVSARKRK